MGSEMCIRDRFSFACIHPDYADWKQELDRIAARNMRGIKLHPAYQQTDLDDPKYLRCASTLKHFYGNNTEVGRGWKNSSIDPRNKYELYLEPFRRCIEESGAEGIMTAYNRINGTVGGMVRENMEISESVIMKQADQKMYENKKSSR